MLATGIWKILVCIQRRTETTAEATRPTPTHRLATMNLPELSQPQCYKSAGNIRLDVGVVFMDGLLQDSCHSHHAYNATMSLFVVID